MAKTAIETVEAEKGTLHFNGEMLAIVARHGAPNDGERFAPYVLRILSTMPKADILALAESIRKESLKAAAEKAGITNADEMRAAIALYAQMKAAGKLPQ